jgi:hypothetical protein
MALSSRILVSAFLLAFIAFATWFIRGELHTPQNEREVIDREIDLLRAGRYDKAIQIIQNWMNDPRRNMSRDGLLYHQLAMVYIAKAWRAPVGKDEFVHRAARNLDKELDLYNRENPTSLRVDLLEIGLAREVLGDLSETDKCNYYGLARQELSQQLLLMAGDFYEVDGRKLPLAGARRKVNEHLDAAKEKSSKAGCPNMSNNG